ncbi:hypothetical protein Tco_0857468 [Tanacetum coccineum]|uniref:Uncharacterized protein n=1 Tax=Tanacetum coccineum TaxID=301880 RepID=A0ABQ5BAA9_9ASTR
MSLGGLRSNLKECYIPTYACRGYFRLQGAHVASIWTKGMMEQVHKLLRRHVGKLWRDLPWENRSEMAIGCRALMICSLCFKGLVIFILEGKMILDKIMNDKDCSLVFGVFELMKWVSEDPSYVTSDEPEYPQELFSAVDLLFLQFLGASCTQRKVSMVSFGRMSPKSFLSSILLVVVIIVTIVTVVVILIVVVVAIVGVVIVVVIFGVVVVVDVLFLIGLQNFRLYDHWFLYRISLLIDPFSVCELSIILPLESEILPHIFNGNSMVPSVPIGIVGICHGNSLCFQSCGNAISNQLLEWHQFMVWSFQMLNVLKKASINIRQHERDNDANDGDDDEREHRVGTKLRTRIPLS